MTAEQVRVLTDFAARGEGELKYVTIPAAELASGMVAISVEGEGGVFYADPGSLRAADGPRWEPLPEEVRGALRRLQATFQEVYPRSLEEWEVGFRADAHPWREVAIWEAMAGAFEAFTAHIYGDDPGSTAKRRDSFRAILACWGAPSWEAYRAVAHTGTLTLARVRAIYDGLRSPPAVEAVGRAAAKYRDLIAPGAEW
jgi:hypothetical protein